MFYLYKREGTVVLGQAGMLLCARMDLRRLRAKKKAELEEFVQRHRNTFYDYADALIRYFRYTGLVSLVGEYAPSIELGENVRNKVELIIKMKPRAHNFKWSFSE